MATANPTKQEKFLGGDIPVGGLATQRGVKLYGSFTGPPTTGRLEFELKETSEAFDGTNTKTTANIAEGVEASTEWPFLDVGDYHWRVRPISGLPYSVPQGDWVSFGNNAEDEADFSIVPHIPVPDITWDPTMTIDDEIPIPKTAIPQEGIDELLMLVKPFGRPATGYSYLDQRVLSRTYQYIEWWYYRNGGCGPFRMFLREEFPEAEEALRDAWEIHVRIKLDGDSTHSTWYRGIIRHVDRKRIGNEVLTEIRGVGYLALLETIWIDKEFSAGTFVGDMVKTIMDEYVQPFSRIIRSQTLLGATEPDSIEPSNYCIKGNVHFECNALRAIRFLSELQGNREWGVDGDGVFYFRKVDDVIRHFFFSGKDQIRLVEGEKTISRLNKIRVEGKHWGSKEYRKDVTDATWEYIDITDVTDITYDQPGDITQIIFVDPTECPDITERDITDDITHHGLFEQAIEVPWLTDDEDSTRWALNQIDTRRVLQEHLRLEWQGVTKRLDASHPIGKIRFFAKHPEDVTRTTTMDLRFGKVRYRKGGFQRKGHVIEMGDPVAAPVQRQAVLTADFYLGQWKRDLFEEIVERYQEQIDALKGKTKQFRYPRSGRTLPNAGKVPGEIFFLITDITNNEGILYTWETGVEGSSSGAWVKLGTRRQVTEFPSSGRFVGEIIALVVDQTNTIVDLYFWDGTQWVQINEDIKSDVVEVSSDTDITRKNKVVVVDCTDGNKRMNLPPAATMSGMELEFIKKDSSLNRVILDPHASELIGTSSQLLLLLQNESAKIRSVTTGWYPV